MHLRLALGKFNLWAVGTLRSEFEDRFEPRFQVK